MSKAELKSVNSRRRRTVAGLGMAVATTILVAAGKTRGWKGLSELLTLAYQLGWASLACHHLLHIYERYPWVGLVRPTAHEFALVVAWGAVAAALGGTTDPKLAVLAACWLLSAALLFLSATDMERARKALLRDTGYRARRATDVIRESDAWRALCSRFAQVENDKVDELRTKLSEPDTVDGNLSRAIWVACCSTVAVGFIAGAGALGSAVMPIEKPPTHSPRDRIPKKEVRESNRQNNSGLHDGGAKGSKTDEESCGGPYDPQHMPEPARKALILAWHDVYGLVPGPMEALGYDIAGCPGPAHPIPGLPGSWYATGYCEGSLRAIAIALDGIDHPVVLLEQAAEFALPLIRNEHFVSAEDRFVVGDGDAYIIDSHAGSFVLFRDDATGGPVEEADQGDGGGCNDYVDRDVAYSIAGPGLIEAWRSVAAITPGGVYPISYGTTTDGKTRIALRSTVSGIVTVARCSPSLLTCAAKVAGTLRRWSDKAHIDRAEVKVLAEP